MKRILRFLKALWRYKMYGERVFFWKFCDRLCKCKTCDKFQEHNWTCGVCGCYVTKKAQMSTENCPEYKW